MGIFVQDSMTPDMTSLAVSGLCLLAVVVAAYFLTRFLGNQRLRGGSGQLRVIEQIGFARDKSVMLLKAGTRYFVVGVSSGSVSLIAELSEDELLPEEARDFKNTLLSMAGKHRGERGESG